MNRYFFAAVVVSGLVGCSPMRDLDDPGTSAPQVTLTATAQHSAELLRVTGFEGSGIEARGFTAADLKSMPRKSLNAKDHDGKEHAYEGVALCDVLKGAGFKFGQSLRGPRLRDYLLAEASDGYGVVIALPEIDPDFSGRTVIVADTCDGAALSKRDGLLRLVISDEIKYARWVRMLARLTVRTDRGDQPAK